MVTSQRAARNESNGVGGEWTADPKVLSRNLGRLKGCRRRRREPRVGLTTPSCSILWRGRRRKGRMEEIGQKTERVARK